MYTEYTYSAGATAAHILSDVVALLTGTTDKNLLSASCDKNNTFITSTVAAGWTAHDTNAATNAQVVKAELADDAARFKYFKIDTNTSGYLLTVLYETWDAGTHSGSNLSDLTDTTSRSQRLDLTNGGKLYIASSARFAAFVGAYSTTWGDSTGIGPTGIFERTRYITTWDTTTFGLVPVCWIGMGSAALAISTGTYTASAPKLFRDQRDYVTGANARLSVGSVGVSFLGDITVSGATRCIPAAESTSYIPLYRVYLYNESAMPMPYGEVSSLCNVWFLPQARVANLDNVNHDGVTFVAWKAGDANHIFIVPKV